MSDKGVVSQLGKRVNSYLKTQLENFPVYQLNPKERRIVDTGRVGDFIFQRLLSKKFRKSSAGEKLRETIKDKIDLTLKEEIPFHFIVCLGGYKHWWTSSFPYVDWAEFFNLRFMEEYIAPILAVHKPGVTIDYESEEVVLERVNNIKQADLDKYTDSFRKLIEIFSRKFPKNFRINYVLARDHYTQEELSKKIDALLPEYRRKWEKEYSEKEKQERLKKAETTFLWKGKKGLSRLPEEEKRKILIESELTDEAFLEADFGWRQNYFEGGNRIPLLLTFALTSGADPWLHLGSCHASIVDFWVGTGILGLQEEKIIPRIVSQTQFEQIKKKLVEVPVNLIALPNFESVSVYQNHLKF